MRRQAGAFFGQGFPGDLGLGQAFGPASVEKLAGFCRHKQSLADQWAELAEGDPEYADVARDAQTDADECFQELMDLKASVQRRAVLEPRPSPPLGPVGLRPTAWPTPEAGAPPEASFMPSARAASCPLYAPKDAEGRCLQQGIPTLPSWLPATGPSQVAYGLGWGRRAQIPLILQFLG